MALAYLPADRVPLNDLGGRTDEKTLYWKRLQQLAVFQEPGPVTSLDFSPRKPYSVASTSSVRLSLYDTVVCEPIQLFSRFKQAVYGVRYRRDGQLVAIGGEEGKLRVFDVDRGTGSGKAPLRSVRVSSNSLRVVDFTVTGKTVVSMADDGYIKVWDLADTGSKPVTEWSAHKDAIRTGTVSSFNENLVISGGYDHMVKLWDTRTAPADSCTIQMDCGFPVEKVVYLPNENLIATAAGPIVKIWDLSAGGRQLISIQQHHKTVTSLSLASQGSALISGAIDRRINVFSTSDFSLIHSMSMAAPVLSLSVSADDTTMAVGMGNLLALHRRSALKKELIATASTTARSAIRTAAPKVRVQEKGKEKETKEILAKSQNVLKLDRVDMHMKAYRHAAAINMMFGKSFYFTSKQEQVLGWLRQLVHRRVIRTALVSQDTNIQINLLRFLYKYLFKNNYFDILRHVAEAFYEVYANEVVDTRVCQLMKRLKDAVTKELSVQKTLSQTIGSLELILSSSTVQKGSSSYDSVGDAFGEPIVTTVPLDFDDGEFGEKTDIDLFSPETEEPSMETEEASPEAEVPRVSSRNSITPDRPAVVSDDQLFSPEL